jgi:phenylacetate-CoA ligase
MRIVLDERPPRVVPPLKITIEHGPDVMERDLDGLKTEIEEAVSARLKIRPAVTLVPPNTLPKDPTKKAKLIEKRY